MAREPDRSYHHRGGDVPLAWSTIPRYFKSIARHYMDRDAIVSRHQGVRLTYGDFDLLVDRLGLGLLALGFRKGDRIGVWATDCVEWLVVQMATARLGVILVNINPAYRPREVDYALRTSGVRGMIIMPSFKSSNYVEMLGQVVPIEGLDVVVVFDPLDPDADSPRADWLSWKSILYAGANRDVSELDAITDRLDPDDAINIQYTSGTTGFPKAVALSHFNILNNALFAARAMDFGPDDRLCVPVPFYHCFGMVLANLLCLSVGAAIVIPAEHFDAQAVLTAIHEERCTAVHGVPTMFIAELEHPRFAKFDLTSLRTGIMAGAPCPETLMKRVMTQMHCREILIGYGQTEASPLTHLTDADDGMELRTQTVGRNLPHQEVKIVDTATGRTVPLGQVGEVCFRGYHVMRGYWNNPDATDKAIDANGWLHSGDLGTMDGNGYVRITGRAKDMIIRGGENIYPAEIEEWLFQHPAIAQAAVFGVPDARLGEEVAAWIQLHDGAHLDEEGVRSHCREGLAHFKTPRHVKFVTEFPMTVTGKLQKFRMREMAARELGLTEA
ncbi:MAG: AMP-binding protein [Alphaproteobacteria bacterium]|nr:AMP-binding protein [Alphaproteobacteria bacterium]